MRAGDTHERWHPGESDEYLRAAIARVNGGDMDELRDKIADILTDATDERHNRTVMGDYDPIDEDPYVTRILDAVAKALTSKAVVRAAGRAIPTDPNFGANTWPDDARVCITAALTEAGITPDDAP